MPREATKKKNDSVTEVLTKVKKEGITIKKESKKSKKIKSDIIIDIASTPRESSITESLNNITESNITSSSSSIINNNGIKTIKLNGKKNQDI